MATSYKLDGGFLISYDWLPALESLSGEDYKALLTALIHLQEDGEALPQFENPMLNIFAAMIAPNIKRRLDAQRGGRAKSESQSRDRVATVDTTVRNKEKKRKENISLSSESDKSARAPAREPKEFTPPTVDEVRAYCQERRNTVDPEKFVDHYTATGWMIGASPMEDWKAAVRKWEKTEEGFAHSSERRTGATASSDNSSFDTDAFLSDALAAAYASLGGQEGD